jgi:hypothetical protein
MCMFRYYGGGLSANKSEEITNKKVEYTVTIHDVLSSIEENYGHINLLEKHIYKVY